MLSTGLAKACAMQAIILITAAKFQGIDKFMWPGRQQSAEGIGTCFRHQA
jgi:hypothetical protein